MKTFKKIIMLSLILSFVFANLSTLKNIKFTTKNGDTGIQTYAFDPNAELEDILY